MIESEDAPMLIVCGLCGFEYVYPNWHKTPQECLDAAHSMVRELEMKLDTALAERNAARLSERQATARAERLGLGPAVLE